MRTQVPVHVLRATTACALSLLIALATAAPSSATTEGAVPAHVVAVAERSSSSGTLTAEDRSLLLRHPAVAARVVDPSATTVTTSGTNSAAPIGCGPVERVQTERTLLGAVAWRFVHRLNRCWSDGRVTSVTNRYGEFYDIDYNFVVGVVNSDRMSPAPPASRIVSNYSRAISNCAGGSAGCFGVRTPRITLTVNGDGTFSTSGVNSG